jgi:hypothetical protein
MNHPLLLIAQHQLMTHAVMMEVHAVGGRTAGVEWMWVCRVDLLLAASLNADWWSMPGCVVLRRFISWLTNS